MPALEPTHGFVVLAKARVHLGNSARAQVRLFHAAPFERSGETPARFVWLSRGRVRRRGVQASACWWLIPAAVCRWPRPKAARRKRDLRLGGALFGGGGGAAGGGYGNTNEGKIVAAAFLDNYNGIGNVVRNDPTLQRNVGTLGQEAAAGGARKAGAVFAEGDVLAPKLANVRLLAQPADSAKAVATLSRNDEVVVVGPERDGYINVQGTTATGWVKTVLVQKR